MAIEVNSSHRSAGRFRDRVWKRSRLHAVLSATLPVASSPITHPQWFPKRSWSALWKGVA